MLDADLNYRYWGHMGRRFSSWDTATKVFLAVSSSSTVASWGFWSNIDIVWKTLSGLSALVAIAIPILNWQTSIATLTELRANWYRILHDYEQLWLQINSRTATPKHIQNVLQAISFKEVEEVRRSVVLPEDKKLIELCYSEVLTSRNLTD
jgi:hypothetical protein